MNKVVLTVLALAAAVSGCQKKTKPEAIAIQTRQADRCEAAGEVKKLTAAQGWALGCSSVLAEYNCMGFESLGGFAQSPGAVKSDKALLKEWWGIEDHNSLVSSLEWLENEGHRKYFEYLGQRVQAVDPNEFEEFVRGYEYDKDMYNKIMVVKENYSKLGCKGLLGWDLSRAVWLCRQGYELGYMSEEETWKRVIGYARKLQDTFESWEDLGRNYLIGRAYWSYEETQQSGDEFQEAFMTLMESSRSPWNLYAWDTDLGNNDEEILSIGEETK